MTYRITTAAIVAAAALAVPSGAQAANSYEASVLSDNPLSFHRLNETSGTVADDASAAARDGVFAGGVGLGIAAPFALADKALGLPAGATMSADVPAAAGTVELWVNTQRIKRGSQAGIISHGDPQGTGWALGIGQKRRLTFVSGGQATQLRANVPSNVWSALAVSWSGGKVRLFVNGSLSKERPLAVAPSAGGPLVLGGNGQGAFTGSFTGKADEVALFPEALAPERIAAHFAEAKVPVNTALPTIAGQTKAGQVLTVSAGTWTDAVTGPAFQWQSCDELGDDCEDIAGATGTEYVLGGPDVGSTLRVVESRSNASGTTAVQSEATKVVTGDPTVPPGTGGEDPGGSGGDTGSGGTGGTGGDTGTGTGGTGGDTGTGTGGTGGDTGSGTGTTTTTTTGGTTAGTGIVVPGTTTTPVASAAGAATCLRITAKSKLAVRKLGTLKLSFPKGCVSSVKLVVAKRKGVAFKKVAFKLDGKVVKTTKKVRGTLTAARLKAGRHVLTVKVTPKRGKARTVKLTIVAAIR